MNSGRLHPGRAAALLAALAVALALAAPLAAQTAPQTPPPTAQQPQQPRPEPDPPELASLRAAFLSGAPDDLERAGQRLSSGRLTDALTGDDRELVLAAASAAPSSPDAVWLLVPLAELARSPDRPAAAAAARSAARIAGAIDFDQLLDGDVPLDWVRARAAEYRAQAADPGRWADVRVSSLEVAAHLRRALPAGAPGGAARDLAALLTDPEPELRRAALELALGPLDPEQIRLIAARASADDDPSVAAAAAQALCDGLAFGDDARPVLAALGGRGLARVRALVTDAGQPVAAREAAARCLGADGSAASRSAVEQLEGETAEVTAKSEPESRTASRSQPRSRSRSGQRARRSRSR